MRVVVAIDSSEQAEPIVIAAAKLLRQLQDPHVRVVTVVDDADIHESTSSTAPRGSTTPQGSWSGSSFRVPVPAAPRFAENRSQALARVHGEIDARNASLVRHHLDGLNVERQVVAGEVPQAAILKSAADLGAELIVVGTRGRRGISRLLMGSTAEGVIRHSPVPVVVIGDQAADTRA